MKKWTVILLLVSGLMLNASSVRAVEILEGVWRSISIDTDQIEGVVAGASMLYSKSPYKGIDDQLWGIPFVMGKYKNFFLRGNSVGYILNNEGDFIFSIVGQPRFGGYEASESTDLTGMQDRDWSFDGGLTMSWNNEYFLMNVTGLTDLLNEHNGHEVKVVFSKEFFKGGITPRVGAKWLSSNLVEYYYGVAGTEAAAGRPAYEGGDTVDFIAGVALGYPLGDHWALYGDFEYEIFGSEIEDSPIVDEKDDFTCMAGVIYRF